MTDYYAAAKLQRESLNYSPEGEPQNVALDFAKSITGQADLTGPGLTFYERARLSFLGDTPEEKQEAFSQLFPEGEFLPIPNTDQTLFRRTTSEAYQLADPSIKQAMQEGRLTMETLRDIGDFGGDAPEIIGEILAATPQGQARGRVVNIGRHFLHDMSRLFAGASGGSLVQQGAQEVAGTQRQSASEVTEQAVGEGMLSMFGGAAGDVLGRAVNVGKRGGLLRATPEGETAQIAAKEMGIEEPLPVSALTDNPLIRLLARQSGSLTTAIGRELRQFNDSLYEKVMNLTKPHELARFTKRGLAVLREQNAKLLRQANSVLHNPQASFDQVAPILKESIEQWWHTDSKSHVDALYDVAKGIEEPRFDVAALQERVRNIISRPTADTKHTVSRAKVDAPNKPYYLTRTEGGSVSSGEVSSAVQQVSQKILSLDPDQAVSVDFLRGLQQEVYDASLPGVGGERILDSRAKALRGAVGGALNSPTNTHPAFRQAWSSANEAAASRFSTRELLAVSQLIQADRPVEVLGAILRPGKQEAMGELMRVLPPETFKRIGRAFQADLMRSPGDIVSELGKYPRSQIRLLMSAPEEAALRKYGNSWARLDKTGLEKALTDQSGAQNQVKSIIDNPKTVGIEDFRKTIRDNGGLNSPFGVSTRSGIMNEFFERITTRTETGANILSKTALDEVLSKFEERGVLKLLTPDERSLITNVDKVRSVLATSADAGTSIRAAGVASGLAEMSGAAVGELVESLSIGRILTSTAGRKLLVGSPGSSEINLSTLRLMGAVTGSLLLGYD